MIGYDLIIHNQKYCMLFEITYTSKQLLDLLQNNSFIEKTVTSCKLINFENFPIHMFNFFKHIKILDIIDSPKLLNIPNISSIVTLIIDPDTNITGSENYNLSFFNQYNLKQLLTELKKSQNHINITRIINYFIEQNSILACSTLNNKNTVNILGSGVYGIASSAFFNNYSNTLFVTKQHKIKEKQFNGCTTRTNKYNMLGQKNDDMLVCDATTIEFIVSLFVTSLYYQSKIINIFPLYTMVKCNNEYITITPLGDTTVENYFKLLKDLVSVKTYKEHNYIERICLQVMFTISVFQKFLKLSHNDLKTDNIMIVNSDDEALWTDENNVKRKISDYDYIQYSIDENTHFYMKSKGPIVKIIDYGLSYLYNDDLNIFNISGMNQKEKTYYPDYYSTVNDLAFFFLNVYKDLRDVFEINFNKQVLEYYTANIHKGIDGIDIGTKFRILKGDHKYLDVEKLPEYFDETREPLNMIKLYLNTMPYLTQIPPNKTFINVGKLY